MPRERQRVNTVIDDHADGLHEASVSGFNLDSDLASLYSQLSSFEARQNLLPVLIQSLRNQSQLGMGLKQILAIVKQLLPGPAVGFQFEAQRMKQFIIGDNQFIDVTLKAVDALDKPATETKPLTVSSSDATICTAAMQSPNVIRVTSAKANLGDATISVTDGAISDVFTVTVQSGPPVKFDFVAGDPQDIPAT